MRNQRGVHSVFSCSVSYKVTFRHYSAVSGPMLPSRGTLYVSFILMLVCGLYLGLIQKENDAVRVMGREGFPSVLEEKKEE